jgi:hypothetical protein
MDIIGIDWLHQQQQEDWRRRIRQLHRELTLERMQPHNPPSIPQGVADKDAAQPTKTLRRLKAANIHLNSSGLKISKLN